MEEEMRSDPTKRVLPPGQELIETDGVRRLRSFVRMVVESKDRGCPIIGVVTGEAGIGKSVAMRAALTSPATHQDTDVPLLLTVRPSSTPRSLAMEILMSLQENPRGRSQYDLIERAVLGLARHNVGSLVVDEADRLNRAGFALLWNLHDRAGCPLIVMGLPSMSNTILSEEQLANRVGMRMVFPPCTRSEILTVVLPRLTYPCWAYNPQDEGDLAMGRHIFKMVGPSLRRLWQLLNLASQLAEFIHEPRITPTIIEEASRWIFLDHSGAANSDDWPEGDLYEYERVSERRGPRRA